MSNTTQMTTRQINYDKTIFFFKYRAWLKYFQVSRTSGLPVIVVNGVNLNEAPCRLLLF